MARISICLTFLIAGLALDAQGLSAEAARPCESFFPSTTQGFVAVADVEQLVEHWNKTQLGQLMADPVMEPFAEDLRIQFEDRWSGIRNRLGMSLEDLRDVAGGEVGVAVILPTPDEVALAMTIDVSGHLPKANELLEKIANTLAQRGAKQTSLRVDESADPVIRFDIPKPADDLQGKDTRAFYCLTGNMLVASTNLEVIRGMLARLPANDKLVGGESLADVPTFKAVRGRCAKDANTEGIGAAAPQIRWFVCPLGYGKAIRLATPPQDRRKGKSIIEVLQNQGFGAVRGVGGFVSFAAEGFEMIHRTAVDAPRPHKKAMKMLVFPGGQKDASGNLVPNDFTPQPWVARDVATYTTFYCDLLNAFDNFGPLFDELFGGDEYLFRSALEGQNDLLGGKVPKAIGDELKKAGMPLVPPVAVTPIRPGSVWGIEDKDAATYVVRKKDDALRVYLVYTGIWDEVLQGLKNDPDGPLIDLRKDLVENLGQRVTVITDYELPITPTSERMLFAIETTDAAKVAAALEMMMKNDPTARRREIDGHVVWEVVEEQSPEIPTINVGDIPSLGPIEEEEEEEEFRLLPRAAVTVAKGHLLVASHLDYLKKVLAPADGRQTLGSHVDFRMVNHTIEKFAIPGQSTRVFSRTDQEYRPTYELIRQGKMGASDTLLGRILNAILAKGDGEVRRQQIDGRKLPPFNVVRRYLGPAGMVVSSEANGWFFKGFTLNKEAQ